MADAPRRTVSAMPVPPTSQGGPADAAFFAAMRADPGAALLADAPRTVLDAVEAIFGEEAPSAALTLVDEHTGEYGTGMMIMHWRVVKGWWWERAWAACVASAPLADRLAAAKPRDGSRARRRRAPTKDYSSTS